MTVFLISAAGIPSMTTDNSFPISELQILQIYITYNLANHHCFSWLEVTFPPLFNVIISPPFSGSEREMQRDKGRNSPIIL
jgi:hypothetical protein